MKTGVAGVVAVVSLFAAAGCSAPDGTINSTGVVCDEFAAYAGGGQPAGQRSEVVTSMGEVIKNADQGVRDSYDGLVRSVDAPESTWVLAADTFAQACFDAGWEP